MNFIIILIIHIYKLKFRRKRMEDQESQNFKERNTERFDVIDWVFLAYIAPYLATVVWYSLIFITNFLKVHKGTDYFTSRQKTYTTLVNF